MDRRRMPLVSLACALPGGTRAALPAGVQVTGVACDSRRVRPGDVFVAVRGGAVNGEHFAPDAVRRGAVAVVAERRLDLAPQVTQFVVRDARRALAALASAFYGRPSEELHVVGITGTNGKTTTAFLVRSILEGAGAACGLIGTIAYDLGDGPLASSMTTPDAPRIQSMLRDMADAGLRYAVMEVSSHALDQRRTDFIRFEAGVLTNLSGDHLDYHGTPAAYREAKARLFQSLRPNAWAVLNADDPQAFDLTTPAGRLWYTTNGADAEPPAPGRRLVAGEIETGLEATRFRLRVEPAEGLEAEPIRLNLPLIGRHNVANALAAAGAALALGCSLEEVRRGLEGVGPVPGRLERVVPSRRRPGLPQVVVDYAHTHDALDSVLSTLKPLAEGRLIVVFGAGGDRDRTKRPKMGRAVERWADLAWITSDNPRSEDPDEIIEEICQGIEDLGRFHRVPDRREAIEQAIRAARGGDLVLIAGKGHETTQTLGDKVIEFDDRQVAREVLDHFRRRAPGRV